MDVDGEAVRRVRRFSRVVAQRIGALHESYLASERPLGAARVLWEIGPDGSDVRSLRSRLDLDSGYLSRLLRSLEEDGLVVLRRSETDKRVRTVRLTERGTAERAVLDHRSDDVAADLLRPLDPRQRDRLVAAMTEVEQLLLASAVRVSVCDPAHADARACLAGYYGELAERFDGGFDPAAGLPVHDEEMRSPAGLFLVATLRSEPVGCGALRFHDDGSAEVKRLWVSASARGLGLGKRLLGELEGRAAEHGARVVRLDTNRVLVEAIGMYRAAGYREVPPFNDNPHAHHWFEKAVPAEPPGS
ncbi:bifunctional helix-turn-helix transcriptional regulator/GNAT family N-acetyltransferase [Umezawaea beigongshangensis]|uniref:bifunctional helix-turn-helix transcriptional regulator/GNAT family N-acetyltransferase n=1 Tax=Umezawaea beigongshangensis TaxID=2780383 RepID=UPI001E5F716C|nr:MarR family winged helix-turn-helix transcriptional regulator [Umezawaea beigongshangensis]